MNNVHNLWGIVKEFFGKNSFQGKRINLSFEECDEKNGRDCKMYNKFEKRLAKISTRK